jgi:TIR domain
LQIFAKKALRRCSTCSWAQSLTNSIEGAEFFLVAMSPNYFTSAWAQEELQIGMLREMERKALVIPLMVTPCKQEGFLGKKKYADFTADYPSGFEELLIAITKPRDEAKGKTGEPTAGETIGLVTPSEIQTLFRELKEAVGLFKSLPNIETSSRVEDEQNEEHSRLRCFIIMPLRAEELNIVYEDFVKPVLENDCDLICERGDDIFGSNIIMDDIEKSITTSHLIVADLTGKNPNVFYEVGISHTLKKPVLLLAQSIDDIPFDLRHRRVLLYEYSPRGCKKLEKNLVENIREMLKKSKS